jgi:DNA polymerase-1
MGVEVEQSEDGIITSYSGGGGRLDEFNPNSSKQILAALKARGADMSYMSQEDGKISADAENLCAVDDELAAAILRYKSEFKVLSTYVRPMIGRSYVSSMNTYKEPFIAPDGRVHATYRQVGTRTGRMSCADPNMQNQPRDDLRLRYNIVAEPGHVLVTCDLTNIEMYLFAAYCGEGRLLTAVQKGEDLHALTAKMLGLRDRRRPGGGIETARQLGKTYNFSRIYGGGLRTIRRSFRCDLNHARLLKKRFDDAYPEVQNLTRLIEYRLEDDGYIQDKLISGRRFRVDPRDSYKATNYLIQGTAASLLKYAVINLHADGIPMVALVHDEIVAHVPEKDAKEAAKLIEQRMTEFEGLKGIIPLRAEADIVQRWSDAKPLQDKDDEGNPVGEPYLFTPQWAGGERRQLTAA